MNSKIINTESDHKKDCWTDLEGRKGYFTETTPKFFFNTAVEQLGIFNDRRNVCIILSA